MSLINICKIMKRIIYFVLLFFALFCNAQVGVGTTSTSATLDIICRDSAPNAKVLEVNNSATTPIELITALNNGNIGINNNAPETSALLELKSSNQAILLTRVANTSVITTPVNGMILYDISSNCVKAYENNAWSNCLNN